MIVVLTGASGLIGSALAPALESAGHQVRCLRHGVDWDPAAGTIEKAAFDGAEAVIHLAGQSLAQRWSAALKVQIRASREAGTRLIAKTLAGLANPPKVLLSASAVGWYGDGGDRELDEDAAGGTGFLAEVCAAWEAAAEPARAAGIRVAHPRLGVVLSAWGGALAKMLPPFRLGLGGRLGSGRQWMSWITLDDAVAALMHLLGDERLAGPVNLAAPQPVTNAAFTAALGQALGRPAIAAVPAAALRLLMGEMADEMLLASQRAVPKRLLAAGFEFRWPQLPAALSGLLAPEAQ